MGCGGTRDSHHGCADDKSAATVWCYHDNMTKISEECFQHLVESMPRRINTVLKAKGVQPGTSVTCVVYIQASQFLPRARGLHGLKTEARTRPVPERHPTRNPPPPQRITKKKRKKIAFHDCMQRNGLIKALPFHKHLAVMKVCEHQVQRSHTFCRVYEFCLDKKMMTVQIMVIFCPCVYESSEASAYSFGLATNPNPTRARSYPLNIKPKPDSISGPAGSVRVADLYHALARGFLASLQGGHRQGARQVITLDLFNIKWTSRLATSDYTVHVLSLSLRSHNCAQIILFRDPNHG